MCISPKGLLATFAGLIKVSFSFLCTSRLIGRHMCCMVAECSWKYIICSLGWVNIAGRLVNPRDGLFWERKCVLSLFPQKSVLFLNKAIFVFMKSSFLNLVCQKHVHATSPTHAVHLIQAVSEGFVNVLKTFFSTDLLIVLSPQKWDLHVGKNLYLFVEVAD